MSNLLDDAIKSNSWAFLEAKRILDAIGNKTPEKGYVLFETGYGPSGLPHIGTVGEVGRTIMVKKAFEAISDIPTKLICFSDDMDGFRKVPTNVPNQEMLAQHLNLPLVKVPDPFGEQDSYGAYMNNKLQEMLDSFGFEYEFRSATEVYSSGEFDSTLIKALENYEQIQNIMLPSLGEERRATYSPFMPICKKTGHVLMVPVMEAKPESHSIVYKDLDGELVETLVTGGNCKLQWKPDFAMRWAALDVDYEIFGKEHKTNAEIYTSLCKIMGGKAPVQFDYEFFLGSDGSKISKSKGNGVSVEEWLQYAPQESMMLFMYKSPKKAKRLYFDVIPKHVDEYLTFCAKYHETDDQVKRFANPAYHIHGADVPQYNLYGLSFALLLNLASVCNPDDKEVLWSFITQYAPDATPAEAPYLDNLAECAVRYYNDFIKPSKSYKTPSEDEKAMLRQAIAYLETAPAEVTAEEIQTAMFTVGKEAGYENLREFFKSMYQILLGQEEGPRLGTFFKLYGISKTIEIMKGVL